jgi:hypothetical protein
MIDEIVMAEMERHPRTQAETNRPEQESASCPDG